MRIIVFILISVMLSGCAKQGCVIDVIIQNLGSERLDSVWLEYEDGQKMHTGVLGSKSCKVRHDIPAPSHPKLRIAIKRDFRKEDTLVYEIQIDSHRFNELLTGYHVLYFQIDLDENDVLLKSFDDFPDEVMNSDQKLTDAVNLSN